MPRILAIDDSESARISLEFIFRTEGNEIVTAENGPRGLKLLDEMAFDAVLLDIHMPGMNGDAVCRAIKANPKTQGIPVIAMTGCPSAANARLMLEAGALLVLPKPFDLDALKRAVAGNLPSGGCALVA